MLRKIAGTVQFDIFNTAQCATHQFILLYNMSTYQLHTMSFTQTYALEKGCISIFKKFQNKEETFYKKK